MSLDWPELNRIMEVNAIALRKMTFRRIEEMLRLARTQPSTTAPVIKVDRQSGSLFLMPFVDANGYKSVMFQLVEGNVNEGPVPDGQIQFDPRKWRTI